MFYVVCERKVRGLPPNIIKHQNLKLTVALIGSDDPADLFMIVFNTEFETNKDANQPFVSALMY